MSSCRQNLATVSSAFVAALLIVALGSRARAQARMAASDEPASVATESASLPPPDEPDLATNIENSDANAPLPAETEPNVGPSVATPVTQGYSSVPRRFHYSLDVTGQVIYDDNINVQPVNRLSDVYYTIDPRLVLGFGDIVARSETFVRFEYTPSLQIFTDRSELDAFQQVARLDAQHRVSRLTLSLGAQIERLFSTYIRVFNAGTATDQVNVDVSNRTRLDLYAATIGASYDLSSKTFLSSSASFSASQYNNLISSQSAGVNLFLNYRYSPKLTFGIGGGAGRNTIDDPDPDETFEQAAARISYAATGKLSFSGNIGVEFRQIESGPRNSAINFTTPVFDLSAVYQPFDGTKLSLTASRRRLNSAVLAGQDYDVNSFLIDLRQRLVRRVTLAFTITYQNLDYFATITQLPATRSDNYYSIGPSIDVAITRFWSAGVFYNRRQNSSSLDNFSFDDNQVGFRASLRF